jgi:hypothetical protein
MLKLQIKEKYIVNGIEYDSLAEAKMAKSSNEDVSPESHQKTLNFSKIPIHRVDVSELQFHQEIFKNVSLLDVIEIRQKLSNDQHRFVLPTYSELKEMENINRFPLNIPQGEYWTSTKFLYNTYISYEFGKRKFNDIYPQYRRDAFFIIKENKPGTWFRDPPLPNSADEIIYLKEKENNNFIHSY